MVVESDDVTEIAAKLATDEISTAGKFYVAELVADGDDDFQWDFDGNSTDKRSPYTFSFGVGRVYDMKVKDQQFRAIFQVMETGGTDPESWDIHVIDRCEFGTKSIDWDAVEEAVLSDGEDPKTRQRRRDLKDLVDGADDETLDLIEQVLRDTDGSRDPGEHTVADLSAVPADVRKRAQAFAGAFGAAFEKQTGSEPGVHLRAAALDAAVMFQKRQAQKGGD